MEECVCLTLVVRPPCLRLFDTQTLRNHQSGTMISATRRVNSPFPCALCGYACPDGISQGYLGFIGITRIQRLDSHSPSPLLIPRDTLYSMGDDVRGESRVARQVSFPLHSIAHSAVPRLGQASWGELVISVLFSFLLLRRHERDII